MKFDKIIEEAEENNKLHALKGFIDKDKQFQQLFKDIEQLLAFSYKVYETIKNNQTDVREYIMQHMGLGGDDPEALPPDQKEIFNNVMNLELLPDMLEDHAGLIRRILNPQ